MGTLLIKHRHSFIPKFDVCDRKNNPKYLLKWDMSIFPKYSVIDVNSGKELAYVKQESVGSISRFRVNVGGADMGYIQEEYSPVRFKYYFDYRGWIITGSPHKNRYSIVEGRQSVARISRKIFKIGISYVVDVSKETDELAVAMVIIAIIIERTYKKKHL